MRSSNGEGGKENAKKKRGRGKSDVNGRELEHKQKEKKKTGVFPHTCA